METTNFKKEYEKVIQILLKDLFKNGLYNLTEWQNLTNAVREFYNWYWKVRNIIN